MQIRTLNHPMQLLFVLVLLALAACSAETGTTPAEGDLTATPISKSTPTSQPVTPSLYPADSQEPAAGICGQAITSPVSLAISADVPSPRCIQITPDQALAVSNQMDAALHVRLGGYEFDLLPGESA